MVNITPAVESTIVWMVEGGGGREGERREEEKKGRREGGRVKGSKGVR